MITIAIFGFAAFFASSSSAQVVVTPEIEQRIQQVENNLLSWVQTRDTLIWSLETRMRHYNVNGLSIAVINDYRIEWVKGYGLGDKSENRPVTAATLFQAASISKSLNSLGVLLLVQQHKLSLDSDVFILQVWMKVKVL